MLGSLLSAYGCGTSRQPAAPEESAAEAKTEGTEPTSEPVVPETTDTASDVTEHVSETPSEAPSSEGQNEDSHVAVADPQAAESGEGTEADIPADFFRCEVKISLVSSIYQAQAIGPTLEEARDNAVDEACAIPCAEQIADKGFSEDESEEAISKCTEACVVDSTVLAGMCWQNQNSVYSEGDWNENGDPAPTNGDETFEIKQGQ
ncbi:MAG: hypothetical protein IJU23_10875 [Proteobacteria bacterium]|nr:hypothetical protein [Pseudomonadota bacterium]